MKTPSRYFQDHRQKIGCACINAIHDVFDWVWRNTVSIILVVLVAGMAWFVYNIWFSDGDYAPPTRSISWIGLIISIWGWIEYDGINERSRRIFTAFILAALTLGYVVVPTMARYHVNKEGQFWSIASVGTDDWQFEGPPHGLVIVPQESAWPRWSFFQKAKNPVRIADEIIVTEKTLFPYFKWARTLTTEYRYAIPGYTLVVHKAYEIEAPASSENVSALREHMVLPTDVTSAIEETFDRDLVARAKDLADDCRPGVLVTIDTHGWNPMSAANPELKCSSVSFSCTCEFRPVVLVSEH